MAGNREQAPPQHTASWVPHRGIVTPLVQHGQGRPSVQRPAWREVPGKMFNPREPQTEGLALSSGSFQSDEGDPQRPVGEGRKLLPLPNIS